jgi:hypothetical protein
VLYLANPCGPKVLEAMRTGPLGYIDTPAQGNIRPPGVKWCADNGAYSDNYDEGKWWRFLEANQHDADTCLFAALPDVVGDWQATLTRSLPWIDPVRALGYPVAIVLQDGATADTVPWDQIDAVFVGGTNTFKLGRDAVELCHEARLRGLWVHVGRVNTLRRLRYAAMPYEAGGCGADSCDGTYLTFGPDVNLPKLLGYLRSVHHPDLFGASA